MKISWAANDRDAVDNIAESLYYQVSIRSKTEIMEQPKLLDQVRNLMRMRHMSHKTERAYVSYIREFILFHDKRHPKNMGVSEIRAFLTHMAVEKNVAAATQNQAFAAK